MSILTCADLIMTPAKYEMDKKGFYSSCIQYAAGLGFSKHDLPTGLKDKLDEWLGKSSGEGSKDTKTKGGPAEKKTRKRGKDKDANDDAEAPKKKKTEGQTRKRKGQ